MKIFTTLIFLLNILSAVYSQDNSTQQKVDYQLDITLQDKKHLVDAEGTITYHNNSGQTLDTIYFQLIANGYKDKNTNFAKDLVKSGSKIMELAKEDEMGAYNFIKFSENGIDFKLVEIENRETIGLLLKEPLLSGENIVIDVKYQIKLPLFFNPKDKKKKVFKLFDIYPAPHVYFNQEWHISPYSPNYYPYKEYGDFDINLKLKHNFTIASSGEIIDTPNNSSTQIKEKWKTVRIKADNINNFALITSPNFKIRSKSIQINDKTFSYNIIYSKREPKEDFFEKIPKLLVEYSEQYSDIPFHKLDIVYDATNLSYSGLIVFNHKDRRKTTHQFSKSLTNMLLINIVSFDGNEEGYVSDGLSHFIHHPNYYPHSKFFSKSRLGMYDFSKSNQQEYSYNFANEITGLYIQKMLKAYVGNENYDRILKSFFQEYKGKHVDSKAFEQYFQKNTDKDISTFFSTNLFSDKQMDYSLVSSIKNENSYEVTLENKGGLALPIQLSAFSDVSMVFDSIIDGFQGTKTIAIETNKEIKEYFLDKNHNSLDNNKDNNFLKTSGLFKKSRIFKPSCCRKNSIEKYSNSYTSPYLGYNRIDGLQIELILTSTNSYNLRHWNYLFAPAYGIRSKKLVGMNQLSYSWFNPSSKFQIIELGYDYKSFHFQAINYLSKDFNLRYQRLAPFLKFTLRKPVGRRLYNTITLRSIQLFKDEFNYSDDNPSTVETKYNRYDRIEHQYIDETGYYPIDISSQLEFHQYNDAFDKKQSYLKLSSTFKTNIYYKANRKIDFRLFAAGFLLNSNRTTNSYNNSLSHGSISLFSQGNNDYTFDGYYFDRLNRDSKSLLVNRSQFGGFGTGIGSAYSYGYSNSYAVALNIKAELPTILPLSLFADFGLVNQPILGGEGGSKNSFLYTSGIEIDIKQIGLEILFPILSSENIHNALLEKGGYFKRISFSIDINKFRIREANRRKLYLN